MNQRITGSKPIIADTSQPTSNKRLTTTMDGSNLPDTRGTFAYSLPTIGFHTPYRPAIGTPWRTHSTTLGVQCVSP
jgi:hypothetical protein